MNLTENEKSKTFNGNLVATVELESTIANDIVKFYSFSDLFLTLSRINPQILIHYNDGRFAHILECFDRRGKTFTPGVFHVYKNLLFVYYPVEIEIYIYEMSTEMSTNVNGNVIKLRYIRSFDIWRPAVHIAANDKRVAIFENDFALRIYSENGDLCLEDEKLIHFKEADIESCCLSISDTNFVILTSSTCILIYHPSGEMFKLINVQSVKQVILTPNNQMCILSINNSVRLTFDDIKPLERKQQVELTNVKTFKPQMMCFLESCNAIALLDSQPSRKVMIYQL